ncbi:MAG TPA: hypothetical protein VGB82_23670 [Alphaproteobacteria bacterium]
MACDETVLTASECRERARECADLARNAQDDPSKALYEQLVLHWLEMATIAGSMTEARPLDRAVG